MSTIAMIFSIGAFILACIALFKPEQTKPKIKKRKSNTDFKINPKFIKEAKSERKHRKKQREKYGIIDENGKIKPEFKEKK